MGGIKNKTKSQNTGFTIVELLIVVVVIAILAAITIVAFNGIQQRSKLSALKSELTNAAKSLEAANVTEGSYPTSLPANVPVSSSTQLSLSQTSSGFCINAQDKSNPQNQWRYESPDGIKEGLCSGAVIAGSEQGLNPNLLTSTNFTSGWHLNFQVSAGRTLDTRPGEAGDPFPTRPVLRLQNTGTSATNWGVIQANSVNRAEILNGQTYFRGYWMRKIGPTPVQ